MGFGWGASCGSSRGAPEKTNRAALQIGETQNRPSTRKPEEYPRTAKFKATRRARRNVTAMSRQVPLSGPRHAEKLLLQIRRHDEETNLMHPRRCMRTNSKSELVA